MTTSPPSTSENSSDARLRNSVNVTVFISSPSFILYGNVHYIGQIVKVYIRGADAGHNRRSAAHGSRPTVQPGVSTLSRAVGILQRIASTGRPVCLSPPACPSACPHRLSIALVKFPVFV